MLLQLIHLVLYGGVAVIGLSWLVWMFVKAPRASLTLLLILAVLEGSREWPVAFDTTVSSINVGWSDIATAVMGGVALGRLGWRAMARPGRGAILGMFAMIGIGLVSWILILSVQPAVNFWRPWTFGMAAAMYAASAPQLRRPHALRPFVWAAILASAMQAMGFALRGFGSNSAGVLVNGESVGARPIAASVALIILMGWTVLLLDGSPFTFRKVGLAAWLGGSVIIAQHRSVWVAAIVAGVMILQALVRKSRQRLVVGTLAGAFLVLVVTAVVRAQSDLAASASNDGTLLWRIANWTEKLTVERSPAQWLVGSTLGPTPLSGPDRQMEFLVSSHSMYVETIATLGLVGFVLLIGLIIGAVATPVAGSIERVLVISLIAFGAFYQWPGVAWLVIGVAIGVLLPASGRVLPRPAPVRASRDIGQPKPVDAWEPAPPSGGREQA